MARPIRIEYKGAFSLNWSVPDLARGDRAPARRPGFLAESGIQGLEPMDTAHNIDQDSEYVNWVSFLKY